jgi:tripartite-type tricarboxylate transporter receptor subunit TctC
MRQSGSMARVARGLFRASLLTLAGLALQPALAWTDKTIKMVVPAPAGGTMDVLARLLAEQLTADIGQPVIVDNKPGAGGVIGIKAMLAAAPDGQTIMVTGSNVLTEIPHVLKGGFDPLKDVRPVAAFVRANYILVGSPGLPPQDMKALVAYVKANPGKISFASPSAGTGGHYAGMIMNQKSGLDMQHVPFAGSPPGLAQVMGGQIPLMFDGVVTSLPLLNAGKIKAYGVAGKTRSSHLPQVPTFTELGFPELNISNWFGVVVSANVPPELVDRINAAVTKAGAAAKVRDRLLSIGFEAAEPMTASQLQQSVRSEFDKNALVVKTFNIQLNQ